MELELLEALLDQPAATVLCTVLAVKGSAPRHAGARMLAGPGGRILGSVGGGRGEAMVLEACARALQGGPAEVLTIDMQGTQAEGPAMVCGGISRILVELVRDPAPYQAALARLRQGEPALLVKELPTGAVTLWDGRDSPDPALRQALEEGVPVLDEAERLYDPWLPQEQLLILGAGHVGQALAPLALGLGFRVTVGDDRPAFLTPGAFPPGVATRSGSYTAIIDAFPFDPATYVVIVSRGHLSDLECVRGILGKPCRYAGFMGSRRKTALILEQVAADGFDPERIRSLHAPIGLSIGAETPPELAVAIAGELIAIRRRVPSR